MKFQIEWDDDILHEENSGSASVSIYRFDREETERIEIKIHPNGQVEVEQN